MKAISTFCITFAFFFTTISLFAQVPNSGFENWTVDGNNDNNPDGWMTTNSDPDVSVSPYTPAYAGNFSMKVSTFDPGFMFLPGTAETEFNMSSRPNFLNVCFKANIMPGDKAYIIFGLYQGDSIVASPDSCSFIIDTSNSAFKCVSFPVVYQNSLVPDSAYILIIAGSMASQNGTYIIVDQMDFGMVAGISESTNAFSSAMTYCYPNPSNYGTNIHLLNVKDQTIVFDLYDINGRLVKTEVVSTGASTLFNFYVSTVDLTPGVYTYTLRGKSTFLTSRFMVGQ